MATVIQADRDLAGLPCHIVGWARQWRSLTQLLLRYAVQTLIATGLGHNAVADTAPTIHFELEGDHTFETSGMLFARVQPSDNLRLIGIRVPSALSPLRRRAAPVVTRDLSACHMMECRGLDTFRAGRVGRTGFCRDF